LGRRRAAGQAVMGIEQALAPGVDRIVLGQQFQRAGLLVPVSCGSR
jgi:hypothetical protein